MKRPHATNLKLKLSQSVIPAQAGIQVGGVLSLATIGARWQGLNALHLSKETKLSELFQNWIPACAGMTECGDAQEGQLAGMRVLA